MRAADQDPAVRLPGEVGIWIFILGDMAVFGLFFTVFVYERDDHPDLFEASRDTLNITLGTLNTLLLLTGSLFVVRGLNAVKDGRSRVARRWLAGAIVTGLAFAVDKVVEYADQAQAGHGISTNHFYMYFYMYTAIHLTHLAIGVCALIYMRGLAGRPELTVRHVRNLENGASYWHMVDLLWIVLFALLYLMG
ncbi:cytochrome C oxidase subunit III [Protofrankia coriariae]|uniref:Cytochrome aa3 subunit 3 n=1 Tax=Protofrankia coriariae TaxID=1562887 RepID=A0ABR5F076_9ACTN|nr:cytochrome C oxidase subunit III [Protofrankia coriariae]